MTNARIWNSWWNWQIVPVTIAVAFGPVIATVYQLTRPEDVGEGDFSLAQAVRGMLCVVMFLSLLLSRRLRLLEHPMLRPLVFLGLYALLTAWAGPYPYENMVFAVRVGFLCLIFAGAFNIAERKLCSENWLVANAWVILAFMAVSQVIGLLAGITVTTYQSEYATGGLTGPASSAAVILVAAVPVFLRFFPQRRSSILAVIPLLCALFLTMRRTELITAMAAILFVLAYQLNPFHRRIPWGKVSFAVLALGLLVAVALQTPAGSDMMGRFSDLDPASGSGSGRYVFWRVSLNYLLSRGIGAQMFGEGMGNVRDVIERDWGCAIISHTDWLDIPHAFGLFGLVGITWWYTALTRFALSLRKRKDPVFYGVSSSIIIFLLMSVGQGNFNTPAFAVTYAALGFWAGQKTWVRKQSRLMYGKFAHA